MRRCRKNCLDCVRLDPVRLSQRAIICERTRGEIAADAGLSWPTVSNAFAGRAIGIKSARAISKALKTTVVEIMQSEADQLSGMEAIPE